MFLCSEFGTGLITMGTVLVPALFCCVGGGGVTTASTDFESSGGAGTPCGVTLRKTHLCQSLSASSLLSAGREIGPPSPKEAHVTHGMSPGSSMQYPAGANADAEPGSPGGRTSGQIARPQSYPQMHVSPPKFSLFTPSTPEPVGASVGSRPMSGGSLSDNFLQELTAGLGEVWVCPICAWHAH